MFKKFLVCVLLLSGSSIVQGQHVISTVAGGGPPNNIPALQVSIGEPSSVYKDSSGNLYIASETLHSIFKVDGKGNLTRVAGVGGPGFGGDGGPATVSHLFAPRGVFVNQSGDIYISDSANSRIRKVVASTGIIQTIVGNGTPGFGGDGGPATSAELSNPAGLYVDGVGNIFIVDSFNNRVRKVTAATGIIQTVSGNGTAGFSGDGGPAINAELNFQTCSFCGLFVDGAGNILIADNQNNRIREVLAATGNITTVAGNGTAGYSGDGGPATSAELNSPGGVFADGQGNLFIADTSNATVREVVAATGNIQTVPLTSGLVPSGLFVDSSGHIFVADIGSDSIVEVVAGSPNSRVAGNGTLGFSGDGGPATNAQLNIPSGVFADSNGNIFFADSLNSRIREVVAATGTIQTVAGNGTLGFSGDNGPATSAQIDFPTGVFVDTAGNLFFSDSVNNRIRRVDAATGIIHTVAGSEVQGFGGDGGPATSASLFDPAGLYVDNAGNLFIADSQNCRIREVLAATNIIQTVAGNGTCGSGGDGGAATSAALFPLSVFVDAAGNIFIGDTANSRIREVIAATNIIQTVAGNGTAGFSGDNGPATSAQIGLPAGVFVDRTGNLFLWDTFSNRIREVVAASGNIQTVVGNGTFGFSGDGGPAINAELASSSFFAGVWGDENSNLYLSDSANSRIRKVTGLVTGPPASITATSGTSLSAVVLTAFPAPLVATVTDAFGNAVGGVTVTFTAPTTGASGTFANGVGTATTNAAGVATSAIFTANGTLGSYAVTASTPGVSGSAAFNLTNVSTLAITTTTLPAATVGTAYSSTLQATGGTPPYTWSISAGTLPAGLTLNSSTGAVTGTPTSGGMSTFTVQVSDSETPIASQSAGLSITVSGNLGTLVVLPQPSTVGFGGTVQFIAQDASGNTIPATWSVSPATGAGTISASGLYQAPASGSASQTVSVTAAAIADSTKQKSVSFTFATNGLSALPQLPQQLTVAAGATSAPTGLQLNGAPVTTASTVPFTLSCVGLPAGAGCIFSLPNSSTTIQSISGTSPAAFCYVFTTGSGAKTTGMISRFSQKRPGSPIPPIYPVVMLCIGVSAMLMLTSRGYETRNSRRMGFAFATVAAVCISVGLLGACNGFSNSNVAPPSAQATPLGTYHIQILATPPPGSGFVQSQLIVPLTVSP